MALKKARLRRGWTKKKLAQKIRQGHGKGELSSYQPWIGIRDLSSLGTSTRLFSPKTGRVMEFLSNVERDTFLVAEFRPDFLDYWEQYPLEPYITEQAARSLGYRHPRYPGTTLPTVMTVDAVLTLKKRRGLVRKAIDCKHSSELGNARTHEKLAISRRACEKAQLPHILVTEQHASPQLVRNILWTRIALPKRGEFELFHGALDVLPMRMHAHLSANGKSPTFAEMCITDYCKWFDETHQLPPGTGLRCAKLLIWHHLVEVDMHARQIERLPLSNVAVLQAPAGWRIGKHVRNHGQVARRA